MDNVLLRLDKTITIIFDSWFGKNLRMSRVCHSVFLILIVIII